MYCKYCGRQIDDDSIYCRHCGRMIETNEGFLNSQLINHLPTRINDKHIDFSHYLTKDKLLQSTRKTLNFIWKVLKTIALVLVGLIAYTVVGFVMSPLIALFNFDIPSLGFFDKIEEVWKQNKSK